MLRSTQRAFSTALKRQETLSIPYKHSSRQLPLVCHDATLLHDATAAFLDDSSLFTYTPDRHSRDEAWEAVFEVQQRAAWLLRSHACSIPETTWRRWTQATANDDDDNSLDRMQSIVQHLQETGETYMKLRAQRLEELFGPKELVEVDEEDDVVLDQAASLEDLAGLTERSVPPSAYMKDFAAPGVTAEHTGILLDAMACTQQTSPEEALQILQTLIYRHGLDEQNNPLTTPTILCLNAGLRLASNWQDHSLLERDHALVATTAILDYATQNVLANSATYTYAMRSLTRHLPDSRSRGNMAVALWRMACEDGVVDDDIVQACRDMMPETDEFAQIREETGNVRHKWMRYYKIRRSHVRENTY